MRSLSAQLRLGRMTQTPRQTTFSCKSPQTGIVSAPGQPPGVEILWQALAGGAVYEPSSPGVDVLVVHILAISGTGKGEIKPRVKFKFIVDGVTYLVDDDSEETPPPTATEPKPEYYSFTGHKPTDVTTFQDSFHSQYTGTPGGLYGYFRKYLHKLTDNNSDPMPGVLVQERFPVPKIGQNLDSHFWYSGLRPGGPNSDIHRVTGVWRKGKFDNNVIVDDGVGWDYIGILVPNSDHPKFPIDDVPDLPHFYYAATISVKLPRFGLLVGTYIDNLWTNMVGTYIDNLWTNKGTHVKQP